MNAWSCNQLGAGGGYPGGSINLPGAGTAITNPSAISAWQASAHTMNSWGQAYQTNSGAGVLGVTPYGPGVFQGTALTAGRTCARYYRHFHSEQGKWIQNTGTKYDNHYISELIYTETDPTVAYAQSDQCWLLDGLWMAGGNAPSVGLQGPGDPNPGQGKNRLVQPDLMERWQDSVFSFHIKDLGPNDQGTQVRNVGDNDGPGAPTYPYGAVPWATDGSQDTVPFQQIYERFRHPECHEYLFERDGMSNTVTSNAYWRKLLVQAFDMYDKLVLDRHPEIVRLPFAIPEHARGVGGHGLVSQDDSVQPGAVSSRDGRRCTRSRVPAGAQGRRQGGYGEGGAQAPRRRTATTRRRGAGSTKESGTVTYLWLRDGAPLPQYDGAPIGSKPECECDAQSSREYVIQPEDSGHWLSVQVTAVNGEDAATSVVTNAILVRGNQTDAQVERDLMAMQSQITGDGARPGHDRRAQSTRSTTSSRR